MVLSCHNHCCSIGTYCSAAVGTPSIASGALNSGVASGCIVLVALCAVLGLGAGIACCCIAVAAVLAFLWNVMRVCLLASMACFFCSSLNKASAWLNLAPRSPQLGPYLAQLGFNFPNLAPTWLNLAQLGSNFAPTWPQLGSTWLNWAPTSPQLGPNMAQLGSRWGQPRPNTEHECRLQPSTSCRISWGKV